MPKLKIHRFPLVKLVGFQRKMYLSDIEEPDSVYAYMFYIEGTKQKIVVDAGASAETLSERGLPVEHVAYPAEELKKVGVTLAEIDLVICTHLHIDHMEQCRLYKNARFIVQKAELEALSNLHPIEAPPYAPPELFENLNFEVIEGDRQIIDGVKVLLTPGHTRGGQSVSVDTAKGKAIISGLCTTRRNFSPQGMGAKAMPVIPPSIHLDVRQAYDSLIRIKNEADIIIPLHDTELADSIP
jgi:glyoxylase-like metal-dependent hydrolase (beta-lactamase superfamily II)